MRIVFTRPRLPRRDGPSFTPHTGLALAGLATILALAPPSLSAQRPGPTKIADSARHEIEAARLDDDLDRLATARALLERALTAYPDDADLLNDYGYALYCESTLLAARGAPEHEIIPRLEEAARVLELAAEAAPVPETLALHSAVLGQRIAYDPIVLGIRLGRKSTDLMDRALELGPENPRVWLLHGITTIFKPGFAGGGLDRARERLERAVSLFATDHPTPPAPSWGRAEAYAWLGQVHQRTGDLEAARRAYQEALRLEPGYRWVRDVLLPALDRVSTR